jgi:response regulator of citrate/malate metabolism
LICAKPGLGLGFRQLERVLCLNHEVSSTAVELAVNLGMASISGKKGKFKYTNYALDSYNLIATMAWGKIGRLPDWIQVVGRG